VSNDLVVVNGDKRDNAFTVRAKVIYEDCFIRSLEGCREQFMNGGEISRFLVSDNHCTDLLFPPIPDVWHPLLVLRTICKSDGVEASCFVKNVVHAHSPESTTDRAPRSRLSLLPQLAACPHPCRSGQGEYIAGGLPPPPAREKGDDPAFIFCNRDLPFL